MGAVRECGPGRAVGVAERYKPACCNGEDIYEQFGSELSEGDLLPHHYPYSILSISAIAGGHRRDTLTCLIDSKELHPQIFRIE